MNTSSLWLLLAGAVIAVFVKQTAAHLWLTAADPAGLCPTHRIMQQRLVAVPGLMGALPSLLLTSVVWPLIGLPLWALHRKAPWWITTRCCAAPQARAAVRTDVPDRLECRCGRRAIGASAPQGSLVYEPLCRTDLVARIRESRAQPGSHQIRRLKHVPDAATWAFPSPSP